MKFGVSTFVTDEGIPPAVLGPALEERGFASLYVAEHSHVPVEQGPPLSSPPDPRRARHYYRTLDPLVTLTAAGVTTERLEVGTGIALINQRDPIHLAKETASLDVVTGGRAVLGVGAGWNRQEMLNHGTDPKTRVARMRESVLAIRAIWENDEAEFHGEFVDFEPSWQWPKPVQQPRIRTLLGGAPGPKLFAHIAEYCDGWIPIGGKGLAAALDELRGLVADQGRDPSTLHIVPFGTLPDEGKLEYYERIGVTEVVLRVPSAPRDEVLPVLDDFTRFLAFSPG